MRVALIIIICFAMLTIGFEDWLKAVLFIIGSLWILAVAILLYILATMLTWL